MISGELIFRLHLEIKFKTNHDFRADQKQALSSVFACAVSRYAAISLSLLDVFARNTGTSLF